MSLVLILLSIVVILGVYLRVVTRARSTIRSWAANFGYRVVSVRFESAFSRAYGDAGRTAEVVYRVVLCSTSGERQSGFVLMWNLLYGRPTVVVRWDPNASPPIR